MSGLLVKSTVVMKENLEELNPRGVAARWPVLLGGAALTRAYVEQDLAEVYDGEVRYARDAFEGLRLMDAVAWRSSPACAWPTRCPRCASAGSGPRPPAVDDRPRRSDRRAPTWPPTTPCPTPPFWGTRVVKGIAAGRLRRLPRRAGDVPGPVGPEGRPRRRPVVRGAGRDRGPAAAADVAGPAADRGPARGAVVYGYFPCVSEGNDLVVLHDEGPQKGRSGRGSPSRASGATGACAWPTSSAPRGSPASPTSSRFQLVTMGRGSSEATAELFADERLPRLPRAARPVGAADRGAGRVVARPGPRRARASAARTPTTWTTILRPGLPRLALLLRLPGLPRPGGPAPSSSSCSSPERIGVTLSEEFQLHPEQSTDAIVVHHPEAKYFNAT